MPNKIGYKKLSKEVQSFAYELLNEVELLDRKNDNIKKLSGGQQQRVAIVRALLNRPKIILADEPTGNLDSKNTEVIYKLMRKFNKKFGITFVIVTHDENIAQMTDRIIEIKDGKINMDVTVNKYAA
jgi:lipoprotein-releasing system ATP-binding protein